MTTMNSARRGSLIAATWLIGLGVVFLLRQLGNLSWAQAWPMFVILAGIASFVSIAVGGRIVGGPWAFTGSVVWTAIGVVLLLSTTGNLGEGPIEIIVAWWPWLAIAVGVWLVAGAFISRGPRLAETLMIPLDGATDGSVRIRFGAGELKARQAAPGQLVDGEYVGGVRHSMGGPGRVELEQDTSQGWPWLERRSSWTVGLTAEVPLDLRVETGASRTVLDLRDLRVRSLELRTGASECRIVVPRAAGATSVHAETGAASLTIEIPDGVAARIRTRVVLGSVQVDEARFPAGAGGYESPDYDSAANRVDIDVQGGVGSLRIRTAA